MTEKLEKIPGRSCDCRRPHLWAVRSLPRRLFRKIRPKQEFRSRCCSTVWKSIGISRGVIVHAGNAGSDNEVTLEALEALSWTTACGRDPQPGRHRQAAGRVDRCRLQGRAHQSPVPGRQARAVGRRNNLDDLKALAPRTPSAVARAALDRDRRSAATGARNREAPARLRHRPSGSHHGRQDRQLQWLPVVLRPRPQERPLLVQAVRCGSQHASRQPARGHRGLHEGAGRGQPRSAGLGQRLAAVGHADDVVPKESQC